MEFQFVCKLKWTANGDLCICQCIWLLAKDKVLQAPSAEQKRAKPNKLRAGRWCHATSVWGLCVGRLCGCVGGRTGDTTRKGRKSEGANTCWFSPETPATYLHLLFSRTSSSFPAVKYLNISLSQHKADQCGALSHLHTPGTKCCHLLDLFCPTFSTCVLYKSWACASTGHKQLASSLGSRVLCSASGSQSHARLNISCMKCFHHFSHKPVKHLTNIPFAFMHFINLYSSI